MKTMTRGQMIFKTRCSFINFLQMDKYKINPSQLEERAPTIFFTTLGGGGWLKLVVVVLGIQFRVVVVEIAFLFDKKNFFWIPDIGVFDPSRRIGFDLFANPENNHNRNFPAIHRRHFPNSVAALCLPNQPDPNPKC